MNKHKLMGAFAAAFLLALPQVAMAEGYYVDLGVGQAKADLPDVAGWTKDDTDTAYSIGFGYKFNNNIAIEGGYLNLGTASYSAGTGRASADVDGFYLGPVLSLPLADKFELNARAGVYFWHADVEGTIGGTPVYAGSDNGEDLYFGIGATYNATKNIAVGVDWTRYDIDWADVDVVSARLKYNF